MVKVKDLWQKRTKSAIFVLMQTMDGRFSRAQLKLESSASSPVATSLEVSMPHQPATFYFPKRHAVLN